MKFKFVLLLLVIVFTLSACSNKDVTESVTIPETVQNTSSVSDETDIHYNIMSADWPIYKNAEELTEAGNIVVLGKVTGISFQMLDRMTAEPPAEDSDEENCYLNTIYDIEVLTSYKGFSSETIKVRVLGGMEGVYLKEQLAVLGNRASEGISLLEGMPEMEIGQTYLFVLYQYEDTMPTLINVEQGIYEIDAPLEKDEYSYVSPKEIISSFGEDKWTAFEAEK